MRQRAAVYVKTGGMAMKLRELLDGLEYQCPSGLETEIRYIV